MSYMKADFDSILKKHGHNVYLNRRTQNTTEAPTYSDTFEIHTVRYSYITNRNMPGTQQEYREGLLNTSERVYYFRSEVEPFEGDRIYELEPRAEKGQIVWQIDQAFGARGINGETVYYAVGCTRLRPN